MSLGDILFASGFDSRDIGIFDVAAPTVAAMVATPSNRTTLSTFHLGNTATDCIATLSATGIKEFVVGLGILKDTAGTTSDFFRLRSPNSSDNIVLGFDGSDHIRIRRGATTLATGTTVMSTNVWYWVWMYVLINDTTGKYLVKLNNVSEIALATGADTRNDAGANGDTCDRLTVGINAALHVDDLYVLDATGTTNNGDDIDIGEVTIPYIVPDSAGDTTGMTRGGADSGANWSQVEEIPPNDATDYVEHATSGTLDLYNLGTVAGMGAVKGVAVRNRVQKDAAGAKTFRSLLKSGGTVSNGTDISLGTSWQTFVRNLRKNPVTSADFTTGEIDALQVGQEVRT